MRASASRPGQFGWLTVWGSPFKITGHPFSFSSSAAGRGRQGRDDDPEPGRLHERRSTSSAGGAARLPRWPYGAFTIGNPADMHVLIAGGIGITPMMSMIRTLADRGDKRPVILLYGSKDWESITFREELEALKARLNLTVVHVLANPPAGWTGEQGYHHRRVFKRHLPPPYADHEYFICGPGRDDGCDRKGARRDARADVEVPFRTLQLRLGRSRCAVCSPTGWSSPPGRS